MKPVDEIPAIWTEIPSRELRRKEVQAFLDCGCKYAEMTLYNASKNPASEVSNYKLAARQLRVRDKVEFYLRKDKVYAERIDEEGKEE